MLCFSQGEVCQDIEQFLRMLISRKDGANMQLGRRSNKVMRTTILANPDKPDLVRVVKFFFKQKKQGHLSLREAPLMRAYCSVSSIVQ